MSRIKPKAETAPVELPEWVATTQINNGDREFKVGDPIAPDDVAPDTWEALVAGGSIAKPSPPSPPRKPDLYRVVVDVLHGEGRSWRQGAEIEEGDLDPKAFRAARKQRQIKAVGDPIKDRMASVTEETDRLLPQLDRQQRSILWRAHQGVAPTIMWGNGKENDKEGMAKSIEIIEGAARAMLQAAPRGEWPNWQKELPRLLSLIEDLRVANAAGHIDSVGILAMSIGMMFTRMSFLLFDGQGMAKAAAARLNLPSSHDQQRENEAERVAERDAEITRLDDELARACPHLRAKSERARGIKGGFDQLSESGRRKHHDGLDHWIGVHNKQLEGAGLKPLALIAAGEIARSLPERK